MPGQVREGERRRPGRWKRLPSYVTDRQREKTGACAMLERAAQTLSAGYERRAMGMMPAGAVVIVGWRGGAGDRDGGAVADHRDQPIGYLTFDVRFANVAAGCSQLPTWHHPPRFVIAYLCPLRTASPPRRNTP